MTTTKDAEKEGPDFSVLEDLLESDGLKQALNTLRDELGKWVLEPRIGPHIMCVMTGFSGLTKDIAALKPAPEQPEAPDPEATVAPVVTVADAREQSNG